MIGLMTLAQPLASSIAQLNQRAIALYAADDFAAALSAVMPAVECDDSTLDADGGRPMPCPVPLQPDGRELRRKVLYRLGRGKGFLIP